MPIDRKALRAKKEAQQEAARRTVKAVEFPLPDLRGPRGNAFVLLGEANALMKRAGIKETIRDEFHREATSGDYEQVLRTIQQWFTVTVADVQQIPLSDAIDITTLMSRSEDEDWPEDEAASENSEEVAEALEDMRVRSEQDAKDLELSKKIDAEIRAELGLGPEDVVVVTVKRKQEKPDG